MRLNLAAIFVFALFLAACCSTNAPSAEGSTSCATTIRCAADSDCPAGLRCDGELDRGVCTPLECGATGSPCREPINCTSLICNMYSETCADPSVDRPVYAVCNDVAQGTRCSTTADQQSDSTPSCLAAAGATPAGGSLCTIECGPGLGCPDAADGARGVCAQVGPATRPGQPGNIGICMPGCPNGACPAGFTCQDTPTLVYVPERGDVPGTTPACVPSA